MNREEIKAKYNLIYGAGCDYCVFAIDDTYSCNKRMRDLGIEREELISALGDCTEDANMMYVEK